MSFVDIGILLILSVCVLAGIYRGFLSTALHIGATLVSLLTARILTPLLAGWIRGREALYNMLLYYTEGAEFVAATDVELTRTPITQITAEQLRLILKNADMPLPMDSAITKNIAVEAFKSDGITTLGDYFNMTIVSVTINIFCIVILFVLLRLILGFLIGGIDYARNGMPMLRRGDGALGGSLGFIHGILLLFVLFLLLPAALVVLPRLYGFLSESIFGVFFYKANILIELIPYT